MVDCLRQDEGDTAGQFNWGRFFSLDGTTFAARQFFPVSETEIPRNQICIEQPGGGGFEFLGKDSRLSGGDDFA